MKRWHYLLAALVGAAVIGALRSSSLRPHPALDPVRDHSSLRTNKWGTKALRQLYARLGIRPITWKQPLSDLAPEHGLVLLLNPMLPPSSEELAALESWVRGGGHLILAVRDAPLSREMGGRPRLDGNHALLAWLGLYLRRLDWATETREVNDCPWRTYRIRRLVCPKPAELVQAQTRAEIRRWMLEHGAREEVLSDLPAMARTRVLARLQVAGRCLGMALALGSGRVDVISDVNILSNACIGRADNALLAAALVLPSPPETAAFDEYHHGLGHHPSGEAASARRVVQTCIYLLLAALAIYCIADMRRMGRALALRARPRRSITEFVQAVAHLQQRAGVRQAALRTLASSVRRLWAVRLGISPTASPLEFAAAARARRVAGAERLARVLEAADAAAAEPSVSRDEFVRLAGMLVGLRKELSRHA